MRVTPMFSMESMWVCFAQSGLVSIVMPTLRVLLVSALVLASCMFVEVLFVMASRQRCMNHCWYSGGVAGNVPPIIMSSILSTRCPMVVSWLILLWTCRYGS